MALYRPHELGFIVKQAKKAGELSAQAQASITEIYSGSDVSEDAALPEQKRKRMIALRKINEESEALRTAVIVRLDPTNTKQIQVGSYIEFEDLSGAIIKKTLSGSSDANEYSDKKVYINVNSPAGNRLLGRALGDEYLMPIIGERNEPSGFDVWTIVKIRTDIDALQGVVTPKEWKQIEKDRAYEASLYKTMDELLAEEKAQKASRVEYKVTIGGFAWDRSIPYSEPFPDRKFELTLTEPELIEWLKENTSPKKDDEDGIRGSIVSVTIESDVFDRPYVWDGYRLKPDPEWFQDYNNPRKKRRSRSKKK